MEKELREKDQARRQKADAAKAAVKKAAELSNEQLEGVAGGLRLVTRPGEKAKDDD